MYLVAMGGAICHRAAASLFGIVFHRFHLSLITAEPRCSALDGK
jgi:hypothetical protein